MKKPELKPGSLALALPAVGVLLLLIAAWLAWSGFQVQTAGRATQAAEKARNDLAQAIRPGLRESLDRLDKARERAALATALQRADDEGAKALVAQGWDKAEAIELIAPDLVAAYADPAAFGYGKLGVLEQSLA